MVKKVLVLTYGLVCYAIFLLSFLYAVGFLARLVVPKDIDSGAAGPLSLALAVDLLLLGLFAVQHSIMARPAFKKWWVRLIPPSTERSTFVLASSLALLLLYWQWRPIPQVMWEAHGPVGRGILWALFAFGWAIVLFGTFMINHAHLFGLSQVWSRLRGLKAPEPPFQTGWLYGRVRHPLMLGFIVAFWSGPNMTLGHLIFAAASTGYIVLATQLLEERDLVRFVGQPYRNYQDQVPAFIPRLGRGVRVEELMPDTHRPAAESAS
jgi:protein-S-isoprenylcysteine O-methyltransferase Ste14